MRASEVVGCRATIVDALHSHARMRAYRGYLVGRSGVIVAVLREGAVALLELDESPSGFPGGVRRWPVVWDDLRLDEVPGRREPDRRPRTGFTRAGRAMVEHAVTDRSGVAVCGERVEPLPVCGWSLVFSPTMASACPDCATLVARQSLAAVTTGEAR